MINNSILLLGSSGTLGSNILRNIFFKKCLKPSSKILNLKRKDSITDFFLKNNINVVIHCAAISSMAKCQINPIDAINTNIIGTQNLVDVIMSQKKKIKLIYISTDGVYHPNKGNNSEEDELNPYNIYCLTKLCAENIVKTIAKSVIVRTRFYDKKKIKFNSYATDIYTSAIEVTELVNYIKQLVNNQFKGVINIGTKRESNYDKMIRHNNAINKCKYKELIKNINYTIAKDASMNLTKMNNIFNNNE